MEHFDFLTLVDEDTVSQPRPSHPTVGSVMGRPEAARGPDSLSKLDELGIFDDFGMSASW